MFRSCFLGQFPFLWCGQLPRAGLQGLCSKYHSGLCIFRLGEGRSMILSQAAPDQMLSCCRSPCLLSLAPGGVRQGLQPLVPLCLWILEGQHCWWWRSRFLSLEETVCWLSGGLPLQGAKGESTWHCCWEDSSKVFLWEGTFGAYVCHLLLVLSLMQEILILYNRSPSSMEDL